MEFYLNKYLRHLLIFASTVIVIVLSACGGSNQTSINPSDKISVQSLALSGSWDLAVILGGQVIDGHDPESMKWLSWANLQLEDYEMAEDLAKLANSPHMLALIKRHEGKLKESIDIFESIPVEDRDDGTYAAYARALYELGKFREAIDLRPDGSGSERFRYYQALSYEGLGDIYKAKSILESLVESDPMALNKFQLARIISYLENSDHKEFEVALGYLLELNALINRKQFQQLDREFVNITLAVVLARMNLKKEANLILEKVLQDRNPEITINWEILETIQTRISQNEDVYGIEWWKVDP